MPVVPVCVPWPRPSWRYFAGLLVKTNPIHPNQFAIEVPSTWCLCSKNLKTWQNLAIRSAPRSEPVQDNGLKNISYTPVLELSTAVFVHNIRFGTHSTSTYWTSPLDKKNECFFLTTFKWLLTPLKFNMEPENQLLERESHHWTLASKSSSRKCGPNVRRQVCQTAKLPLEFLVGSWSDWCWCLEEKQLRFVVYPHHWTGCYIHYVPGSG